MAWILSFDVESNGLHGAPFAFGGVVLDEAGTAVDRCEGRCPIEGEVEPWVRENVLPALEGLPEGFPTARGMREKFWRWLIHWKSVREAPGSLLVVADCGWPVEAGLLSRCVADDPAARAFAGPYPLHEVATLFLACGLNPLAEHPELWPGPAGYSEHYKKHHPYYDALVSGMQAHALLQRLSAPGRVVRLCDRTNRGSPCDLPHGHAGHHEVHGYGTKLWQWDEGT